MRFGRKKQEAVTGGLTQLPVNLTSQADRALERAAKMTGLSKTDTLNRALQAYLFLEEQKRAGNLILIQDKKGTTTRMAWK